MDPADLIVIEPEDCERYQLPDGSILHLGRSDHMESMGFFEVFPGKAFAVWGLPASGFLKQTEGSAAIVFPDQEKTLQTTERLEFGPNHGFTIRNAGTVPSLTFFKYRGDVGTHFEELKKLPHLPYEAREKSAYKNMYQQHTQVREEYAERGRGKEGKKGFFSRFRK